MSRGGQQKDRDEPERRCLASGEVNPRRGLIRFVIGPDDEVVPDIAGKLPGRGMYVSAERDALDLAVTRKLFSRGAKRQVRVPEGLVAQIDAILLRRVLDRISLARKAGAAVAGYEKAKDWLMKEQAAILLQASDGSERGKTKLRPPGGRGSYFDILTGQELGLAFGREHVIHAALAAGALADRFRDDAVRLSGVRDSVGGDATGKVKKTL
ncbi:RNA-binding protein [Profundibacterium mesophilum]|uniref:Nucleic-acid-binding protein implicated in transcription termination Transcription n=1 Tax=Profundibacterium mesophilum KAUST100406-0324 TaxID=1037889 RepID=A0A921TDL9_9RHOB|nr:RNA-binding protein [Profundibacterium mesophilum]KAF0676362.1 putative nucleic-acid-binding protein implicated in transcription termination Transcription [Profundibacterium mesophilum KAUST100406-0324]